DATARLAAMVFAPSAENGLTPDQAVSAKARLLTAIPEIGKDSRAGFDLSGLAATISGQVRGRLAAGNPAAALRVAPLIGAEMAQFADALPGFLANVRNQLPAAWQVSVRPDRVHAFHATGSCAHWLKSLWLEEYVWLEAHRLLSRERVAAEVALGL